MNEAEWLIQRARKYWDKGEEIPLNLVMEMSAAGLLVEELEKQYLK